jgi:hypothetical protein
MISLSTEYLEFKLQKSMYLCVWGNCPAAEALQYRFTTSEGEIAARSFCGDQETVRGLLPMA